MTRATVTFQALELKGSLLPASLLEEVSKFNRPKELLLDPHDYGLSRGERLRDRIDAAWVLTKELWEDYGNLKERAGASTAGLHFGLRLLREVFGWSGVEPCSGWQQGESRYPITHRAFDGAVPLILRGIDAGDLDRGSKQFGQDDRKRSPHSCLQECLNADDTANWGVLLSGDGLRLLHDTPSLVKPAYLAADLELMIEGERFDSCTSGLALPPTAHRTAQSESSQEAQPLVHRLIKAALGPSAEQRHRVLGYWSGGGSLWLSLQRRQPMHPHVQPAQGGAVEQVKRQRGSLEAKDPGGDPNHQPAGIHGA